MTSYNYGSISYKNNGGMPKFIENALDKFLELADY